VSPAAKTIPIVKIVKAAKVRIGTSSMSPNALRQQAILIQVNVLGIVHARAMRAASVVCKQPIECLGELALIAAAGPSQPMALLLPHVAPAQLFAELLGAVALLRPPHQRAH
jgi:hypothetical protein